MAILRFMSSEMEEAVAVDTVPGERRTMLTVARGSGVPILSNCGVGHCGACVVRVETRAAGSSPPAPLTDAERLVLQAMGLLTAEDIEAADRRGVSARVRLACQYALGDEEIDVTFESGLGSR